MFNCNFVVLSGLTTQKPPLEDLTAENKRGTLEELATYFKSKTVKGEIVIVVGGKESGSKEQQEEAEDQE